MGRPGKRALVVIAVVAVAVVAVLASLASASGPGRGKDARVAGRTAQAPAGTQLLYVGAAARVHPIRAGFLGLSIEYPSVEDYAGTNPRAVNPVFLQLIRNLTPGQAPVLRIGGDSTDHTWWPLPGTPRPGGVRYSLSSRWLAVTRALAQTLGARLILGLNLEAGGSRIGRAEAQAFSAALPRSSIAAFEPGNEPELYGTWTYYRARDGRKVKGRAADYSLGGFEHDFASAREVITSAPLAGPTTGSLEWMSQLGSFIASQPHLRIVTLHRYPLQVCYFARSNPRFPTIANLLSPASSRGLASLFAPAVRIAHAHGLPLRVDEMNTIGCGSDDRVAHTFASALWALDTLFALAQQGVDGVNVHTYPHATYNLFNFASGGGRWYGQVAPEYYGLLAFATAAPPGAQPLNVSGPGAGILSAWATRGPDGHTRVVLINEGSSAQRIGIRGPGGTGFGSASLTRLSAPHLTSASGISLGGQSFAPDTYTGQLQGSEQVEQIEPTGQTFVVDVAPGSAALVELP